MIELLAGTMIVAVRAGANVYRGVGQALSGIAVAGRVYQFADQRSVFGQIRHNLVQLGLHSQRTAIGLFPGKYI